MLKKIFSILFLLSLIPAVSSAQDAEITRDWFISSFITSTDTGLPNQLCVLEEYAPRETKINLSTSGTELRLRDQKYEHGISCNSPSRVRVISEKPVKLFSALVGVDDNARPGNGSVHFRIENIQNEALFTSPLLTAQSDPLQIDLEMKGLNRFDLIIDDGGDGRGWDQGDWCNARLQFEDGTEIWLDELGPMTAFGNLPFSFVYGDRPSEQLLPGWERKLEVSTENNAETYRLSFTDPETFLEVLIVGKVYLDTPGADWTVYFTNHGEQKTPILRELNALKTYYWCNHYASVPILEQLAGSTASHIDWAVSSKTLDPGKTIEIAPFAGRSSMGASPFFQIKTDRGGIVTAIGWTGQWKAETCKEVNGPLWIRAGLQKLNLSLEPGETIRSPRILQVYWEGQGNDMQGCNDFRRTMIAHIMPKIDGKTIVPPITHMSCCFSIPDDTATEADIVSFIEPMKEAGFEYLWHDAFYAPKKFPLVGDYSLPLPRSFDPVRFPEGFANIARKTEEAGLKYLQWYEPERICPGSIVATEHPEWTVIPPNQPWGGIDLGNPDAWRFVYEFLAEHVRVYGIDALRIDNAVSYSALWGELDSRNGENRVGIAEIRYVEGLYRLWDALLAEFPGLFIDNCASGGMRIDLEMCARSIPLWRTDATIGPLLAGDFEKAAECNQIISSGLNRYLPASTSGQRGCSPYCFRSGFNGGIVFADDIRKSDYPMEELKAAIREGKRIRKYFYGDYYLLTPPSTSSEDWCIMQYDRPEEKDGLVMLFRRGKSPYSSVSLFRMENIDPDANYEITVSRTYTPEPPRILKGSEFKEEVFQMPGHPESMIIEYKKL